MYFIDFIFYVDNKWNRLIKQVYFNVRIARIMSLLIRDKRKNQLIMKTNNH
jgi:hypothetical protein